MKLKNIGALVLALAMIFALSACKPGGTNPTPTPDQGTQQPSQQPSDTPAPTPSETPSQQPSQPVTDKDTVRLAVLSGPTGIGAAKLLSWADANSVINHYEYTIATDNSELVAGLTNPEPQFDIATVASNVALNLYNKTNGGVKIIALGTRGVLHILEGGSGNTIESVEDLRGETIYSPGQGANPEYILRYVLTQYGLEPGVDVDIVFADASEITAKLLSGEISYAMLPVPAATAAIIKGQGAIRAAIDMTEAWNEVGGGSQLIMTAVVARTQFVEEHPDAVNAFLAEYEASIDFVNTNLDEAAQLIAGYGITPNAAIAKQAIPQCNLAYIAGEEMSAAISDYYMELFWLDPAAVGGSLPDDAIYYVP